jgi:hypothetical protein
MKLMEEVENIRKVPVPNLVWLWKRVFRILIRMDPHSFSKLDPDPHYFQSWIRIRIHLKSWIRNTDGNCASLLIFRLSALYRYIENALYSYRYRIYLTCKQSCESGTISLRSRIRLTFIPYRYFGWFPDLSRKERIPVPNILKFYLLLLTYD